MVFLGLGTTQNWAPHPGTPYYPGIDVATKDVEYDPARANQILDSIGLDQKDAAGGFRLRTDGSGERLVLNAVIPDDESVDVANLVKQTWADVGIDLQFRTQGDWWRDIRQNKEYLGINLDYSAWQHNPWNVSYTKLAPITARTHNFNDIGRYYESEGETGQKPTDSKDGWLPLSPEGVFPADVSGNITRLYDLWQEGRKYAMYDSKRIAIGKEIYSIHADEKYDISTVGFTGVRRGIAFARNNYRNVPHTHVRDCWGFWRETYYFEGGKDNIHHPDNRSKLYKSTSFIGG